MYLILLQILIEGCEHLLFKCHQSKLIGNTKYHCIRVIFKFPIKISLPALNEKIGENVGEISSVLLKTGQAVWSVIYLLISE